MSDTKYLILEQHIFGHNVQDVWTVKFANITRDKAFEKMVALDTLNEDRKNTSYHLQEVNFSMVDKPLILTDEVKQKELEQGEMPF